MNLTTNADRVMMFCILASIAILDAFSTLLSIFKKGVFVDQKSLLMQKTNRELRAMLVGVEKISKLNKTQLVDLLLLNYWIFNPFLTSSAVHHSINSLL